VSLRILIAPDKFKGTLTALEAAGAIANGWWHERPQDIVELLPMSDGGDGFGDVMSRLLEAESRTTETVDAAHRPLKAEWWHSSSEDISIIESARVIGLAQLPAGRFHPFDLDTRGLAPLLRAVRAEGAARCYIGIGGSATNDGGFGLAKGLGWTFEDTNGKAIDRWIQLSRLGRIIPPAEPLIGCEFIVAVDVENPLLGMEGCSRIYGPQKGLTVQQAPVAEAALTRLANLVRDDMGMDIANEPGAGAAGGLGFGLRVFANATQESGFEIFAQAANLDSRIEQAHLIITGEGSLDQQSLMGKGTGRMAQRCKALEKRCIGLAGSVEGAAAAQSADRLFHLALGLTPTLTSPAEAKAHPALWLERLASRAAAIYES